MHMGAQPNIKRHVLEGTVQTVSLKGQLTLPRIKCVVYIYIQATTAKFTDSDPFEIHVKLFLHSCVICVSLEYNMHDIFFYFKAAHEMAETGSGPLQQNDHTETECIHRKNEKYNYFSKYLQFHVIICDLWSRMSSHCCRLFEYCCGILMGGGGRSLIYPPN